MGMESVCSRAIGQRGGPRRQHLRRARAAYPPRAYPGDHHMQLLARFGGSKRRPGAWPTHNINRLETHAGTPMLASRGPNTHAGT